MVLAHSMNHTDCDLMFVHLERPLHWHESAQLRIVDALTEYLNSVLDPLREQQPKRIAFPSVHQLAQTFGCHEFDILDTLTHLSHSGYQFQYDHLDTRMVIHIPLRNTPSTCSAVAKVLKTLALLILAPIKLTFQTPGGTAPIS